jgi:hypothetical protein
MKFDIYETNKYVIAGDTDSLFIMSEPLLIKKFGDNYIDVIPQETIIEEIKKIAYNIENKLNDFLSEKSKEILNIDNNKIEFKTETIIKTAYWGGKRRYAQHIIDKEGVPTDTLSVMGLDIMKSNFPPHFQKFGEELIKNILSGRKKDDIDKFVIDFKKSLKTIDWKKILKPTGLKKLNEYIDRKPGAGEIFSKIGLKCPINTKAAIYYNDLLRFKKLDKKHPTFQVGDKMYIAYLKENPYKLDCIGYNGYSDPQEITELIETYIDREGLFDSMLKNKIENLYNDLGWGFPVFNPKVFQFFKF